MSRLRAGRRRSSAPACPRPAELALQRERPAKDLRVEGAGEPAVARERHDRDTSLLLVLLQERQAADRGARAGRARHQLEHAVRVRPHASMRCCARRSLRRGDELQRARDLPRVPDRADAAPDVLNSVSGHPSPDALQPETHFSRDRLLRGRCLEARACLDRAVRSEMLRSRELCSVSSESRRSPGSPSGSSPPARRYSRSSSWKRGTCSTGMSSRKPFTPA